MSSRDDLLASMPRRPARTSVDPMPVRKALPAPITFSREKRSGGLERTVTGLRDRRGPVVAVAVHDGLRSFGELYLFRDVCRLVVVAVDHALGNVPGRLNVGEVAGRHATIVISANHGRFDHRGVVFVSRLRKIDGHVIGRPLTFADAELEALGKACRWLLEEK